MNKTERHRRLYPRRPGKHGPDLDGEAPTNVYDMVLKSVERPMLEVIMQQAGGNQAFGGRNARHQPQHPAQEDHRTPAVLKQTDTHRKGVEDAKIS